MPQLIFEFTRTHSISQTLIMKPVYEVKKQLTRRADVGVVIDSYNYHTASVSVFFGSFILGHLPHLILVHPVIRLPVEPS